MVEVRGWLLRLHWWMRGDLLLGGWRGIVHTLRRDTPVAVLV